MFICWFFNLFCFENLSLLTLCHSLFACLLWLLWSHCLIVRPVFQFVGLEALTTAISDMNPSFFHVGHRRKLLLLAISIGSFFIGLVMVTDVRSNKKYHLTYLTVNHFSHFERSEHRCWLRSCVTHPYTHTHIQGGLYIFQLFDYYACSGMTLLLFAILQSLCIGWVYGELLKKRNVHHF